MRWRKATICGPPVLALILLTLFADRRERGFILGDLEEEFHDLARDRGRRVAVRWYWSQAIRSAGALLASRLTSAGTIKSASAILTASLTAILSATAFGLLLGRFLSSRGEPTFPTIAMVVVACALVSSTCAGCAWAWVAGRPNRWAISFVGIVVLLPDIVYTGRSLVVEAQLLTLLPLALAIVATFSGLALGGRLWRFAHPNVLSGDTP